MDLRTSSFNYNVPLDLRVDQKRLTPVFSNINYQHYPAPLNLSKKIGFSISELLGDVEQKSSTENVQPPNNSINAYSIMFYPHQQNQINQSYYHSNLSMHYYTYFPAVAPITIHEHKENNSAIKPTVKKSAANSIKMEKALNSKKMVKAPNSRKVKMTAESRQKANERERNRVDDITKVYSKIRTLLGLDNDGGKTSKVNLLRFAIQHINYLDSILLNAEKENQSPSAINDQ